MKLITAVIKPFKLEDVRQALAEAGVQGMTVTEVKGFGQTEGAHRALSRGRVHGRLRPKDEDRSGRAGLARRAGRWKPSRSAAGTGSIGDGKVFVFDLEHAVRIRTGETGDAAL